MKLRMAESEDRLTRIEAKLDQLLSINQKHSRKRTRTNCSNLQQRKILQKFHKSLVSDFNLQTEADSLLQHGVISKESLDEVLAHSKEIDKTRTFLLKLSSYDSSKFTAFLNVLEESHSHLAEAIKTSIASDLSEDEHLLFEDEHELLCIPCEIKRRVSPEEVIDDLYSSGIIGGTAMNKYLDPKSDFKRTIVWEYAFDRMKLFQHKGLDTRNLIAEVLEKHYSDISQDLLCRENVTWKCVCENILPFRAYTLSDSSSILNEQYLPKTNNENTKQYENHLSNEKDIDVNKKQESDMNDWLRVPLPRLTLPEIRVNDTPIHSQRYVEKQFTKTNSGVQKSSMCETKSNHMTVEHKVTQHMDLMDQGCEESTSMKCNYFQFDGINSKSDSVFWTNPCYEEISQENNDKHYKHPPKKSLESATNATNGLFWIIKEDRVKETETIL